MIFPHLLPNQVAIIIGNQVGNFDRNNFVLVVDESLAGFREGALPLQDFDGGGVLVHDGGQWPLNALLGQQVDGVLGGCVLGHRLLRIDLLPLALEPLHLFLPVLGIAKIGESFAVALALKIKREAMATVFELGDAYRCHAPKLPGLSRFVTPDQSLTSSERLRR
jgi:hypothetical protein